MQNDDQKRRRRFIVALIAGMIALVIVVLVVSQVAHKKRAGTITDTYDSNSGQTISEITGKTPEKYGQTSNQPTYLGLDKLIDHGLSVGQIKTIQDGYGEFVSQNKLDVKVISIAVASIDKNPHSPTDPSRAVLTYTVVFNSKTSYSTQVLYSGLSYVNMTIRDGSNKQVFNKLYDPNASNSQYDNPNE